MHPPEPQHSATARPQSLALADFVATGGYSGRLTPAPGTWGTAAACALAWVLFAVFPSLNSPGGTVALAALMIAAGIYSANVLCKAQYYGAGKDPQKIVIDEFAGFFVTIIGGVSGIGFVLAFGLFRVFDITKPPPARQLEKLPDGYGIVLDDVAAGIYALICRLLIEALLFST